MKTHIGKFCTFVVASWLTCGPLAAHGQLPRPTIGSKAPADVEIPVGQTGNPIAFFDDYSWRTFLAINWPAQAMQRGVADLGKTLGDKADAVVWETWKSDYEIFQPNGQRPAPWESFATVSPCPSLSVDRAGSMKVLSSAGSQVTAVNHYNQAGLGPPIGTLICQNGTYTRYEIRVNQKEFEFIRGADGVPASHLYLKANLPRSDQDPLVFPFGSIEIKAAWREFKLPAEKDLIPRYYARETLLVEETSAGPKCRKATMGLVGLHIVHRTPSRPEWIWSTFEHVDNLLDAPKDVLPSFTNRNGPQGPGNPDPTINRLEEIVDPKLTPPKLPKPVPVPTQVVRLKDVHGSTKATNALYRAHPSVKSTVWANYQLVMTQWPTAPSKTEAEFKTNFKKPYPAGAGEPFPGDAPAEGTAISNATMETFGAFQLQFSCMKCHQRLKPGGNTEFVWFLSLRALDDHPDSIRKMQNDLQEMQSRALNSLK